MQDFTRFFHVRRTAMRRLAGQHKNASVDSPLRQPFPRQQKSPLSKDSGRMGEPVTPGPHRLFC